MVVWMGGGGGRGGVRVGGGVRGFLDTEGRLEGGCSLLKEGV